VFFRKRLVGVDNRDTHRYTKFALKQSRSLIELLFPERVVLLIRTFVDIFVNRMA
jgi:hypothetical protein